jgi:glycosyltransferase involved in cell wall biosynthesis
MVSLEDRFFRTQNGNIYSNTTCDYNFWKRYLQVFDEVGVFGRLSEIDKDLIDKPCANGPHVHFICPVSFIGPWEYLKKRRQLNALAKLISEQYDAFILRVPGTMSSLLWHQLIAKKKPYGVEVVGDPWDVFSPGSLKTKLRPFLRYKSRWDMVRQCRHACVASYVTEFSLQKRYPPGCWSTHYSSIDLPDTAFVDESFLEKRIARVKKKSQNNGPWHICHVGMMEHLYKSQDVLLNAVGECIKKGIKIELSFVGDGIHKTQLQKQAKELGIVDDVRFLGKLDPDESVYEILDSADLYILPSRQEGLPQTIIEAMARGLPCISSTVGGIPELLEDKYLVLAGEAKMLSDKIIELLNEPDEMVEMSKRNVKTVQKYRSKYLNLRRIEFYHKLVDETLCTRI